MKARPGAPRARPGGVPAPGRRVSLKELARLTGFSITTVSMVLNGRAAAFSISDETRDRILAVARVHRYQPNLQARSLRSRSTGILGLLVPQLTNPFFGEMAEVFERLARADRRLPLIAVTHFDRREEVDTLHWFLSQKAECVFTANPSALQELSDLCTRDGTAQIVLDAQPSGKHTVTTHNERAARELTALLLDSLDAAGRRGRVYFVGGTPEHQVTRLRLAGVRAALAARGRAWHDDQFVPAPFDPDPCYEAVRRLFRERDDIAGVFLHALPSIDGLVRFYPEAPERCQAVHYAAVDLYPASMSRLIGLKLVALRQDPAEMMRRAYAIFGDGEADGPGVTQYVPHALLATPTMEPLLRLAADGATRPPGVRPGAPRSERAPGAGATRSARPRST